MKESDIRPADVFEEYLRLSAEDSGNYFRDVKRQDILCPGCGSKNRRFEFIKHGFDYVSCANCDSLYQSPRPPAEAFEQFYSDSRSSRYWAEKFYPSVAEARRALIFLPRVKQLTALCRDKGMRPEVVMDVGAGYGIFLEEWKKQYPENKVVAVEPSKHLAQICRDKGLVVIEKVAERIQGHDSAANLVVCFEVFEHVYNPLAFVRTLAKFVAEGGCMMVSTLGVDGFDIQVLWENSNSISPPHHINFLSVKGLKLLFERAGLKDIEVLTPGVLDVDIVRNAVRKDPSSIEGNRFVNQILNDNMLSERFQTFLKNNQLSSHTWIFAKKPDTG